MSSSAHDDPPFIDRSNFPPSSATNTLLPSADAATSAIGALPALGIVIAAQFAPESTDLRKTPFASPANAVNPSLERDTVLILTAPTVNICVKLTPKSVDFRICPSEVVATTTDPVASAATSVHDWVWDRCEKLGEAVVEAKKAPVDVVANIRCPLSEIATELTEPVVLATSVACVHEAQLFDE
jgi:hypothetical protein